MCAGEEIIFWAMKGGRAFNNSFPPMLYFIPVVLVFRRIQKDVSGLLLLGFESMPYKAKQRQAQQ